MGVKIENKLIVRKNKSSYSTPLGEVIKELNEFNEENGTNISYGKYVGFKAKGWLYMLKKKKTLEDDLAELEIFNREHDCNIDLIGFKDILKGRATLEDILKKQKNSIYERRVGETLVMSCGKQATIIAYRSSKSIDVKFSDGSVVYEKEYRAFLKGQISYPNNV